MFRKPKKSAKKAAMRRTTAVIGDDDDDNEKQGNDNFQGRKRRNDSDSDNDDDNGGDHETSLELQEARKRAKMSSSKNDSSTTATSSSSKATTTALHHYEATTTGPTQKELATATNEYHPTELSKTKSEQLGSSSSSATQDLSKKPPRNKFLAGPIRAPTNIRTTSQFDYQPDICKDYKDTGFCGFGDTCIYLHDRGDTLSGWQLEQKWQQEQSAKKKKQEQQLEAFMNGIGSSGGDGKTCIEINDKDSGGISDDGIPFACHLCRGPFKEPIVTPCGHYFCQSCLHNHFQQQTDQRCPICQKDTHGVMNQPTKLISKKRKVVGRNATWEEYFDKLS